MLYRGMGDISYFYKNNYHQFSDYFEQNAISLANGTKMTKAISEIFKNKELDTAYSKLIDRKTVKGIVEVSIDPIDYITMSFNNSGWHSCYTISVDGLANDFGGYVAGTLSYMCDSASIIAYKHSNNLVKMKLGSSKIEDYSKNWRQVIYLDTVNYTMMYSREYPRKNAEVSKTAREMIEEAISKAVEIPNEWSKMKCKVQTMQHYISNCEFYNDTLVYNDILHNNSVEGNMIYNKKLNNRKDTSIVSGSNVICPYCGEKMLSSSSTILCEDCD